MTAELLRLAERCEKETAGSRELDELIMAELFRREERHIGCQEEQDDGSWQPVKNWVWVDPVTDRWVGTGAREYTSSLDDAMSLLGRNAIQTMSYWPMIAEGYEDELCCRITLLEIRPDGFGGKRRCEAKAATPALALTAAALRALASRDDAHQEKQP